MYLVIYVGELLLESKHLCCTLLVCQLRWDPALNTSIAIWLLRISETLVLFFQNLPECLPAKNKSTHAKTHQFSNVLTATPLCVLGQPGGCAENFSKTRSTSASLTECYFCFSNSHKVRNVYKIRPGYQVYQWHILYCTNPRLPLRRKRKTCRHPSDPIVLSASFIHILMEVGIGNFRLRPFVVVMSN